MPIYYAVTHFLHFVQLKKAETFCFNEIVYHVNDKLAPFDPPPPPLCNARRGNESLLDHAQKNNFLIDRRQTILLDNKLVYVSYSVIYHKI